MIKLKRATYILKIIFKFLHNRNKTLRYEIANIRNQEIKCETYISIKKKVKYLHETPSKFTKGK